MTGYDPIAERLDYLRRVKPKLIIPIVIVKGVRTWWGGWKDVIVYDERRGADHGKI